MSEHLLVQISDIHLTLDGTLPVGVRPRDNLLRGIKLLDESGIRPDVYLLTGDLADAGAPACYDDLMEITAPLSRSGATVVYLPGNHDNRSEFHRHLLGAAPTGSPINQVRWHEGLRLVCLDSTIPGEVDGELAAETLAFLASELASSAPDGTVVALHHPPIPTPIEPMSRLRLRNPGDLQDAINGSDVRIVLCGHNHHEALGVIGSTPVWVSPSSAYLADITRRDEFRGIPGSAFSRIDLTERELTVTVVPIPLT